jgi:pimeloyl-ACP methyl ester carboxylesterase
MPALPQLDGVTHRHVEVAGLRLHVAEAGAGDPVLLVHGWPQHWWCWRHVLPLLAGERRVICLDLRGFGWSDAPPGRYDKATFAADIVALLDALEIERADLVAHDWGAWAGFLACLGHPDRFRSYLALNMYPPWPERRPSPGAAIGLWRLWYQVLLGAPGLGPALVRRTDFAKRVITTGAVHPEAWTDADLESFAEVLREPARAKATARLYRTFLLRELVPYAAGTHRGRRLTVPTLLLHGTRDVAVDHRHLGDWQAWADRMSVELRDDSGHFIAEELPDVVAGRALALSRGEL